jgi:hypothetical protein
MGIVEPTSVRGKLIEEAEEPCTKSVGDLLPNDQVVVTGQESGHVNKI